MKFNPSPEYLLVSWDENEDKVTASGLIISSGAVNEMEKLRCGIILEVGYEGEKNGYSKGDRIVYSKYAPTKWEDNFVLNYKDILGRLT